jgi:hypothetical protein
MIVMPGTRAQWAGTLLGVFIAGIPLLELMR